MDPRTGEFHALEYDEIARESISAKRTAEELELVDDFRARQGKRQQSKKPEERFKQDPRMEELYIKATRQPVPASWPIFTVGDILELSNEEFNFRVELREITRKDLVTLLVEGTSDIPSNSVGMVFLVNGYSFRVRKEGKVPVVIDGTIKKMPGYILRPVVGTPRNYLKR